MSTSTSTVRAGSRAIYRHSLADACLSAACGGGGGKLAVAHNDEWTEDQYGEGAFCSHCHVVLPLEDAAKAPAPLQDELQRLEDHVDPERVTRS